MARGLKSSIVPEFVENANFLAGFHDKIQRDELPVGAATVESYNFMLDKDGKWTTRLGCKYLGTKSSDTGGCASSAKLLRRDNVELPVIFYSTKSKYLHPDTGDWATLETGLTSGLHWGKAMGEKSTDNVNYLIMCNGTDNYRYWSGVTGLVSSVTGTTIVLQGTTTLANLGFTATGSVSVDGVPYAYTGLSGQTFTGVTPDPSAAGVANGNPVTQLPVANAALPKGNVMVSYNGRIVIFASPSGVALTGGGSLLGSKLNVYDNFGFSSPRVASEGYQIVMNEGSGNGLGIVHFEDGLALLKENAVSLHKVTYDANDYPTIQPFLPYDETLSGHIGVVGKKAYFALRNQVFFVSPRKVINSLQRVVSVDYPQALPFSDRIQNTVDDMGWDSETCAVGFNYTARFCGKADPDDNSPSKQLIYDQRFDCWWTPFVGQSISSYFVYDGKLYGTLADSPDVIELDVGYTDFATATANGNPINAKLTLGRMNNGTKTKQKREKRRFIEGWMSRAGTVTVTLTLNEGEKTLTGTITGSADGYFFQVNQGGSFGIEEFGVETFGGEWLSTTDIPDGVGHFRILFNYLSGSFWNAQISFETSSYFKLITNASDTVISPVGIPPSLKTAMS